MNDFITTGTRPLVTVLVLNWNGGVGEGDILPRCLNALAAQTFRDFEVCVLDNASSDGSAEFVETRWPAFQIQRFSQNLGFAISNNRGAAGAKGRWLVVLNNDAFPEPGWLAALVQAAQNNPGYNFFASRVLDAGDPSQVQAAGDVVHASGCAWSRRCAESPGPDEVFSATAAAAMYDRAEFQRLGGFAEVFVSHLEDVDLGFRLRLAGGRCLYVPDAVVAHIGSVSYGRESPRTVYQVQRNLLWMYVANMPGRLFWKYLPAHLFAQLFFLAYYSLRGQAATVLRAKWDALRGLPAALKRRKRVQAQRRVPVEAIDACLDRGWLGPYLLGRRGQSLRRALSGGSKDRPSDQPR